MKISSVFILGTTILLSGCFVTAKPINRTELSKISRVSIPTQEPLSDKIDVYEAIARALKYNLDQRVDMMQEAVRLRELRVAGSQSLPGLVLGSSYTGRDSDLVSANRNIDTGQVLPSRTTSSDRNVFDNDIRLSLNILDFGLSYTRMRQAADRVLLQREIRRRTLNRIVEDVRVAYWRAVASEKLLDKLKELEKETQRAIVNSRSLLKEGNTAPLVAVSYERDLLEIRREIQAYEGQLHFARAQLTSLMSLPQTAKFVLSRDIMPLGRAHLNIPPRELFRIAIMNRPEVREIAYELRINEKDAEAAFLQFFPGVEASLSQNMSTNTLLLYPDWISWGAKASWNLIKLFQYPENKKLIQAQKDLLRTRAMALTVAIMTQVYVARVRYMHAEKEFNTASELITAQKHFFRLLDASARSNLASEQELLREKLKTIVSEVKYDMAYADLQAAYGSVFSSLGLDTYPVLDIQKASLKDIKSALHKTWIAKGDLTIVQYANRKNISTVKDKKYLEKSDSLISKAHAPLANKAPLTNKIVSVKNDPYKNKYNNSVIINHSGVDNKKTLIKKSDLHLRKNSEPVKKTLSGIRKNP